MIKSVIVKLRINDGALRKQWTGDIYNRPLFSVKYDRQVKKAGASDITNYPGKFAQMNLIV